MGTEQCFTIHSLTHRLALRLAFRHHIDPTVANTIEAVERIETVLTLICQRPLGLTFVAGKPFRTQNGAAVE